MSSINFTVNLHSKDPEGNFRETIYGVRSFEVTHVEDPNSTSCVVEKVILKGLSGEPEDVEVEVRGNIENSAGYYCAMYVTNLAGKTIYVLR